MIHPLADILRARILAIACGYEDADDLDHLRRDPGFKLACGRLPDSRRDLCSRPTMSRWENALSLREVIRLMRFMKGSPRVKPTCSSGSPRTDASLRKAVTSAGEMQDSASLRGRLSME